MSTVGDAAEWNAFLETAPHGHLLQSFEWGELKARHGWEVHRLAAWEGERMVGAAQLLFRTTPLGAIAYVPRGPAVSEGRDDALDALLVGAQAEAHRRGAIYLKVEPNTDVSRRLLGQGFITSTETIQPRSSLVLDLSPDEDELLARQKSKTRYNVRLASRRGVSVRRGGQEDVGLFHQLMVVTGQRDGFAVRPRRYFADMLALFGDRAWLLLADSEGETLAGIIVVAFAGEAVYLYGASSDRYRERMPNYLLQWQAITGAKRWGCLRYDFWGVPEAASEDSDMVATGPGEGVPQRGGLWGVYRFKAGFGGELVSLPGAFDYVCRPLRYRLWRALVPRVRVIGRRWRLAGG